MSESTCTHDFWLHVAPVDRGSYCPLCMQDEIARLRAVNAELVAIASRFELLSSKIDQATYLYGSGLHNEVTALMEANRAAIAKAGGEHGNP